MDIQAVTGEAVQQYAAPEGAVAVVLVPEPDIGEVQPLVIQVQAARNMVGNLGEVQGDASVVQAQPPAGEGEVLERSFGPEYAAELAAELGENALQQRPGIFQAQPVQGGFGAHPGGGGLQVARNADSPFPVQVVAHVHVETVLRLVPDTLDLHLSQPFAGDPGGVAGDGGQKTNGRG